MISLFSLNDVIERKGTAMSDATLAMQLKEHVHAVAAVIDRVDVESIKAFWR